LALFNGFLHGDVRHEPFTGCAVPMLLARLDIDDVTRSDLLNLTASPRD
jgi:hypothetical protein